MTLILKNQSLHRHFAVYKPYGYLSQFVNNGQKQNSKKLLGELSNFPEGTMAIGRLDEKSEGLLLLTTDGKVSNHICSRKIEKEYYVQIDGIITFEAIQQLAKGVEIGFEGKKYTTAPCKVFKLDSIPNFPQRSKKIRDDRHGPTGWISITLQEGKFRQVRKMTSAVGFPTLRLVRIRVGTIHLNDMKVGEVRELNAL
ncbi:pseudouridine synthase [Aquimarina celericrescens]|uniref:Pseudouridine synthase n=1 Tax=Aquimarina celericrescens TaxID=1964542 RepID=A0ABW5B2H2_9FLAO|nr:pseudouridine synthase [Aquimarina celericrescens]